MITYLTGSTGEHLERGVAHKHGIGVLIQPGNGYHKRLAQYPVWAADNGAFTQRGVFDPVGFRTMLQRPNLVKHVDSCLFVVAPDVLRVLPNGMIHADAVATLRQYAPWATEIRAAGLPTAFVAQNGLERMLDDVPWHLVDALFVGGSTEWKLSRGARLCVEHAKRLGKRTHMGRVNSYRRLAMAQAWGVDSADGTFLAFAPDANLPRLLAWLQRASSASKQTRMNLT